MLGYDVVHEVWILRQIKASETVKLGPMKTSDHAKHWLKPREFSSAASTKNVVPKFARQTDRGFYPYNDVSDCLKSCIAPIMQNICKGPGVMFKNHHCNRIQSQEYFPEFKFRERNTSKLLIFAPFLVGGMGHFTRAGSGGQIWTPFISLFAALQNLNLSINFSTSHNIGIKYFGLNSHKKYQSKNF